MQSHPGVCVMLSSKCSLMKYVMKESPVNMFYSWNVYKLLLKNKLMYFWNTFMRNSSFRKLLDIFWKLILSKWKPKLSTHLKKLLCFKFFNKVVNRQEILKNTSLFYSLHPLLNRFNKPVEDHAIKNLFWEFHFISSARIRYTEIKNGWFSWVPKKTGLY